MKKLFLVLSLLIFQLTVAHSGSAYNTDQQKKYYASQAFKQDVKKYCSFNTDIVASNKRQIQSLEQGKEIIRKLADFPNKHIWFKDIDTKNSFLVFNGQNDTGMVYHFTYKNNKDFLSDLTKKSSEQIDYYRETNTPTYFKGCMVYSSSSMIKFADFEYKVLTEGGKVYLQRTARGVPNIPLPKLVAQKKLEQLNKDTLDEVLQKLGRIEQAYK